MGAACSSANERDGLAYRLFVLDAVVEVGDLSWAFSSILRRECLSRWHHLIAPNVAHDADLHRVRDAENDHEIYGTESSSQPWLKRVRHVDTRGGKEVFVAKLLWQALSLR